MNEKRLYRSVNNRMLGGVCAGVADYLAIDPTLVRLGVVFTGLLGYVGPLLLAYVVMVLVVPEAPVTPVAPVVYEPAAPVEPVEPYVASEE